MLENQFVCKHYRQLMLDGQVAGEKLLNPHALVTKKHMDHINGNTFSCGEYYVIDEEATKEFRETRLAELGLNKKKEAKKKELSKKVIEAVDSIESETKKKTDK